MRITALLVFAVCSVAVNVARTAEPAFVGVLALAVENRTAKQLGLSEDVRQKLLQLIQQRENKAVSLALEIKDLPPEQRTKRLAPFVAESEKLGLALLTVQQRSRLDQIRILRAGMASLARPEMAVLLKLDDHQKMEIQQLLERRAQAMREGGAKQRTVARDTYERQLRTLLTDNQKASWDQLAGLGSGPDDGPAASNASATPPVAAPNETPTAEPTEPQPVPAETNPEMTQPATPAVKTPDAATADNGPAPTEKPVAKPPESKTGPDDRKPGTTRNASDGGGDSSGAEQSGPVKLRFSFHYQPWKDVLDWLAEQADLSLQSDIIPEGTCNYTDSRAYTPTEAIDLINGILLPKGYTLLRRGRLLNVINLADEVPDVLVEFVPVDKLDERGEFELVKTVFHLAKMDPADAEREIGQLLGQGRSMVVMPKARQIMVIETAGKLRTIREVIEKAENPSPELDNRVTVLKLEHVSAEELLAIARPLLGLEENQNVGDGISIAVDTFGTRLFVTGSLDKIDVLQDVVQRVDQEGDASGSVSSTAEQPQLMTHPILTADPDEAMAVLQTLLAGEPNVRLGLDPKTKKIIALAPPSVHKTIIETLKQLEGDAPELEVIQLHRIDPQLAVLTITNFFEGSDEDETLKVDADPTTMKLYVRAKKSQIEQIKLLIDKLEGPAERATVGGNLRFVPLGGSSVRSAVDTAKRLWTGNNTIRLCTPSGSEPSLFNLREVSPDKQPGIQKPSGADEPAPSAKPSSSPPATVPTASDRRPPSQAANRHREKIAMMTASKSLIRFASRRIEIPGTGDVTMPVGAPALPKETTLPKQNGSGSEIRVEITPNGVLIASNDVEALNKFEELLRTVAGPQSLMSNRSFTVYFLKYCKAETAQQLIQEVLGGGAEGGGSLLGDVASGLLGGGGGILGALMSGGGASGDGTTTVQGTGPISIVADARLNCLLVQAIPTDIQMVEELLKVIDREGSITEVQTQGKPYIIPVLHVPAEEIANVVREAFAGRIATKSSGGQRGSNPVELIRALRGGRGRGGSSDAKNEPPKMTLTVDARSNSLILLAPEPLYEQVRTLVNRMDQAGLDQAEEVQVVSLRRANPEAVQKVLAAILQSTSQSKSPTTSRSPTSSPSSSSPSFRSMPPEVRARIMQGMMQGRPSSMRGSPSSSSGRSRGSGRPSSSRGRSSSRRGR